MIKYHHGGRVIWERYEAHHGEFSLTIEVGRHLALFRLRMLREIESWAPLNGWTLLLAD